MPTGIWHKNVDPISDRLDPDYPELLQETICNILTRCMIELGTFILNQYQLMFKIYDANKSSIR
jgi:hypothetical protein